MTTKTIPTSPCPIPFSDHTFKEELGVSVPLRIWPTTIKASGPRPWLLWIHGGGMFAGKHWVPNAWVVPACRAYGLHCVSVGYRFVPHVSAEECLQDCQDALTWCRSHLPEILGKDQVSIDQYLVGGDSAGGTLSLQAGLFFHPRPRVVIDVFGLNDLLTRHDRPPAPAHAATPVYLKEWGKDYESRFQAFIDERDLSKAKIDVPWDWELEPNMNVETLRSFWGVPDLTPSEDDYFRMDALKWCHYHAKYWGTVHRQERFPNEKEYREHLIERSPFWQVDKTYPPTFFIHGVKDTAVPVEQSYNLAKKLRGLDVPTGEVYDPEGAHSFDNDIEGPENFGWKEYIVPCMEFVTAHLGEKQRSD